MEKLDEIVRGEAMAQWKEWATFLERALAGDEAGARGAFSEATRAYLWNDPDGPWIVASTFALAGATDDALTWLERAVERGWINYPLFQERDPLLAGIRGEERFARLIARVKERWEAFEPPAPLYRAVAEAVGERFGFGEGPGG